MHKNQTQINATQLGQPACEQKHNSMIHWEQNPSYFMKNDDYKFDYLYLGAFIKQYNTTIENINNILTLVSNEEDFITLILAHPDAVSKWNKV